MFSFLWTCCYNLFLHVGSYLGPCSCHLRSYGRCGPWRTLNNRVGSRGHGCARSRIQSPCCWSYHSRWLLYLLLSLPERNLSSKREKQPLVNRTKQQEIVHVGNTELKLKNNLLLGDRSAVEAVPAGGVFLSKTVMSTSVISIKKKKKGSISIIRSWTWENCTNNFKDFVTSGVFP